MRHVARFNRSFHASEAMVTACGLSMFVELPTVSPVPRPRLTPGGGHRLSHCAYLQVVSSFEKIIEETQTSSQYRAMFSSTSTTTRRPP